MTRLMSITDEVDQPANGDRAVGGRAGLVSQHRATDLDRLGNVKLQCFQRRSGWSRSRILGDVRRITDRQGGSELIVPRWSVVVRLRASHIGPVSRPTHHPPLILFQSKRFSVLRVARLAGWCSEVLFEARMFTQDRLQFLPLVLAE